MTLIKEIVIGLVSILETKDLQVREDTIIREDGIELSRTYMRYVARPGDDVSDKPKIIQDLATLLWTSEVIEARRERDKKAIIPIVGLPESK
jgi:aryl-phospho-beta-D-glucosidase BglC (GH1 family)